ncbi:MAG: AMIN domain-containing protein [Campylobacterota bacterium]|nr:AMIN domain-containing protein [Campylobacterota bacterium]
MKIILTFMFIITLSLDLFGRTNPFEPTDTFNEKKSEYYKIEKQKKDLKEQQQKNKAIKIAKIKEKMAKAKIKQTKQNENFKILPFVNVEIVNDILIIKVDKKYKLLNQDILKKQKKFLFDFKGNISFYTVRKMIKNKNFKSFAVGTHRKKNFFRVVVELEDDMIKYKEIIYSKKGMITIQKIKK